MYFVAKKIGKDGLLLKKVDGRVGITHCQEFVFNQGEIGMIVMSATPPNKSRFTSTCRCFVFDYELFSSRGSSTPQDYLHEFHADTESWTNEEVTLTFNETLAWLIPDEEKQWIRDTDSLQRIFPMWVPPVRKNGSEFPQELTLPYLNHSN